ncbi:beta-galactosidase trimerization domain-containing protein [Streptomyces olindensis]|uniref:beta-galactosidase trimerization domain-containing protein n=1 Tax=Streptomyces olindensis TaxID=358823 RepID=UPI0036C9439D
MGLHQTGHTGTATDWQDVIDLAGAETLAAYTDGELKGGPAVTRHRFGTGTATYLGTSPDRETLRRLVLDCVTGAGVTPALDTPAGVEAVRRRAADGTAHLFLLNHTPDEVTVVAGTGTGTGTPVDLLAGDAPAPVGGHLCLPPFGAAVLRDAPAQPTPREEANGGRG